MISGTLKDVAGFITFDRGRLSYNVGVPRFAQANALRESRSGNRCRSTPLRGPALGQAMYAFHVAAASDSQPRHTRVRSQTGDLFIQRHQRKDVFDSFFDRQLEVLKRELISGAFAYVVDCGCSLGDATRHK